MINKIKGVYDNNILFNFSLSYKMYNIIYGYSISLMNVDCPDLYA